MRGGWSSGGIQGAYDAAGGMYVGGTVVGLPTGIYKFAALPLHSPDRTKAVRTRVAVTFPDVPAELANAADFCLASLVLHVSFIRSTVPPTHPIFRTSVFQSPSLLDELPKQVKSGYDGANSTMVVTGISPHVTMLSQMKAMQDATLAAVKKIEVVRVDIVRDVVEEFERRGAIAARLTNVEQRLRDAIAHALREAGVNKLVSAEDFVFSDASARRMWILWRCGNPAAKLPPFKLLESPDMPTRNCQKRLSDVRCLMNKIELKLEAIGKQKEQLTIEEATVLFVECANAIKVSDTTKTSRKRCAEQLSWKTVASLVRKKHQVSR